MTPKHLKRWTSAPNYLGPDFFDYFIAVAHTRDSEPLEESNFAVFRDRLQPYIPAPGDWPHKDRPAVNVARLGHWACGWVEVVLIHEDAVECLKKADELFADMDDYPVLDDEDFSRREALAEREARSEE